MKKPLPPQGKSMHDSLEIINLLSADELIALNEMIVCRLKEIQRERYAKQAQLFKVGDFISFNDPSHQKRQGIVLRIHQKTIKVFTLEKVAWNVSPTLLTKVKKPSLELEKLAHEIVPKIFFPNGFNES